MVIAPAGAEEHTAAEEGSAEGADRAVPAAVAAVALEAARGESAGGAAVAVAG